MLLQSPLPIVSAFLVKAINCAIRGLESCLELHGGGGESYKQEILNTCVPELHPKRIKTSGDPGF